MFLMSCLGHSVQADKNLKCLFCHRRGSDYKISLVLYSEAAGASIPIPDLEREGKARKSLSPIYVLCYPCSISI